MVLTYRISPDDRIHEIGGDWDGFADRNGAPALTRPAVEGTSVWDHIHDAETKHLMRAVIDRCRQSGREFRLPFRCDSPDTRRFMELRLRRDRDGFVSVESETIREERRAPVRLLERTRLARGKPIRMCSWCKRLPLDIGEWAEVEVAIGQLGLFDASVLPPLSHGICPACYAAVEAEISPLTPVQACA